MNALNGSVEGSESREELPGAKLITVLGIAVAVCALEISMVFSALPSMIRQFGDPAAVLWVVTIHYLVAASSGALCGRLGDLFGRKRMLLMILGLAVCGALVSFISGSLLGVIIGRGMQAVSSAAIPLSFGLVRELTPPARAPFRIGIVASIAPVIGGVGALLGGLLVDHASWRALFGVSAALSTVATLAVWTMLPQRTVRAAPRKIDVLGGILIPPAIAAPLLAVHFSRHWTWLDARTLGLLAAGLALLVFWIFYESRQNDPLIDVRLLKRRQIGLANLGMALFGLGALQNVQVLSMLLQQPAWTGAGLGVSATTTGLLFVPFIVINLIGGPLSGRVAARYTSRIAALVGMCLTSVGWIAIALEHSSLVFVMACGYLQTLGVAMLFAALPNLVVEDTPRDRTSEATGVLSVVRQFAASIGTQIVGFTLSTSTVADEAGVHFPSEKAVMLTLGFIAVISALAIVATMLLPRRVPLRAGA